MTEPGVQRGGRRFGMQRRVFLLLALGAAVLGAGAWLFGRARRRPVDTIVAILREKLADLNVDEHDLRRHAEAYVKTLSSTERALLVGLTGLALPSGRSLLGRYRPPPSPLRELEDGIVGSFLLSTDFFLDGAVRPPRFVQLYDPYAMPCRNPFARFD